MKLQTEKNVCLAQAPRFSERLGRHHHRRFLNMALAAYRHLLRATRIAFEGDHQLLHSARTSARAGFDKQASLDSASKEATVAIAHAEGVAEVLKHNVVQGVKTADETTMSRSCYQRGLPSMLTMYRASNTRIY